MDNSIWELKVWAIREVVVLIAAVFFFYPFHQMSENIWMYLFKRRPNVLSSMRPSYFKYWVGSILIISSIISLLVITLTK